MAAMPKLSKKKRKDRAYREAADVFLEYHYASSWAHDKLRSGTAAITPQAVMFMRDEIARRKDAEAHKKDLEDRIAAEDLAAKLAANAE